MSAELVAAFAGVLSEHQMMSTTTDACTCGWGALDVLLATGAAIRGHRAHAAAALAAATKAARDAAVEAAWYEGFKDGYVEGFQLGAGGKDVRRARNPYTAVRAAATEETQ